MREAREIAMQKLNTEMIERVGAMVRKNRLGYSDLMNEMRHWYRKGWEAK